MSDPERNDRPEPPTNVGRDETDREERRRQIRRWAEFVRTHPDEEWGRQVNELIESQLAAAQAVQFERPDLDHMREAAEESGVERPEE